MASRILVILGTGWGGYSVLRNVNKKLWKVIVISPRNHFLFTPLLASTTVGTLEFRSIIEPVRDSGFGSADEFHLADAVSWHPENKTLECESIFSRCRSTIDYDKLVIAVGALPNTFNVPGVHENAIFLKELSDARRIRNRLLDNFERSQETGLTDVERGRLLHTVIVGGGPTGVEFGAELYDFVQQDVSRLYKNERSTVKVTLVESHQILASFDKRLRNFAEKKISSRKNFNMLKTSVKVCYSEVGNDYVVTADGYTIPCGLVVWSTGLSPRPFIQSLNINKNRQGQILTDNNLRILGDRCGNSYAVGDCADVETMALPCTAQVAERQGRYVASTLNQEAKSGIAGEKPFTFKSMGMLAYIGGYQALSDLPEFKLTGFSSWFLWRSAYLTRLGSWRLRMQVPLDWLKTFLFGRDTSKF